MTNICTETQLYIVFRIQRFVLRRMNHPIGNCCLPFYLKKKTNKTKPFYPIEKIILYFKRHFLSSYESRTKKRQKDIFVKTTKYEESNLFIFVFFSLYTKSISER